MSMKGMSTWKPASRTPEKRPSRSTTKALCCGTTTAVLATTKTTKTATTTTSTKAALTMITPRPLLRPNEERQTFHPDHVAALAAGERHVGGVAGAPRRPAQLHSPGGLGRQVLERHRQLAHQRVDGRPAAEPGPEAAAQQRQRAQGEA